MQDFIQKPENLEEARKAYKNLPKNKNLLFLNASDLTKNFGIAKNRACNIIKDIRNSHKTFYLKRYPFFQEHYISTKHFLEYIGYEVTEKELLEVIFKSINFKKDAKLPII